MSLYMESSCVIDVAKYKLEMKDSIDDLAKKEAHILACIKMLNAAEKGNLDLLTSNLTVSECQHLGGIHNDDVRRLFRSILTSGKVMKIVTDSVFISERAQELRWTHDINLRGADAHHLATAIEAGCDEFITFDDDFLGKKDKIDALGIRVTRAHESNFLPVERPPVQESPREPGGSLFDLINEIQPEREETEEENEESEENEEK